MLLYALPLIYFSLVECSESRGVQYCDPSSTGSYVLPHPQYCDKYIVCQKGIATVYVCEDGLAYLPFKGCYPMTTVDCSSRPLLQPPRGNGVCRRRYGVFPDPKGCGRFVKCVNGTAIPDKCADGLMFDEKDLGCLDSTKEEAEQCQQLALLGCNTDPSGNLNSCAWFRCPSDDTYPFGDHSRHPYPGNCGFYILCVHGGAIKINGCPDGTVYNPLTSVCAARDSVPACRNWRGNRQFLPGTRHSLKNRLIMNY